MDFVKHETSMTFSNLWRNRVKPSFGTAEWLRVWSKRTLTLPSLMRSVLIADALRRRGATIGEMVIFGRTRIIGNRALLSIDDRAFIGNVELSLHASISIGKRAVVNDHCQLVTASHDAVSTGWDQFARPIIIEDFAWIAQSAMILPGVRIGRGAVVGAGAVVATDVDSCSVVVGNPARRTPTMRPSSLAYDPIRSIAFVEAWLGRVVGAS